MTTALRNKTLFPRRYFISAILLAGALFASILFAYSGSIDSTHKYAYGENVGWINFGTGSVNVTDTELSGYAWNETTGWISLNCANDSSCGTIDYKISQDGSGNLSGYAYGENVGWINFSPTSVGVIIQSSGEFTGYAYNENTGWISFNCSNDSSCGSVDYKVKLDSGIRGARVSNASDTLSDSRPGVYANHTLQFTVNHAITASGTLEFSFPAGFSMTGGSNWYSNSWGFRKQITIDTSKVAGSATSFPVLINSTDPDWRHTDWGGHTGVTSGWDFVFTDSNGTTKLDHEIEKFASSTGELIAWVRIPFLSSTTTNSLYIYYGNPDSTDQQNKTGVWETEYAGVWHMTTTSSQTTIIPDSTANSGVGSKYATNQPFSSSTGTIDGAQDFDGIDDYISFAFGGALTINGDITVITNPLQSGEDYEVSELHTVPAGTDLIVILMQGWQVSSAGDIPNTYTHASWNSADFTDIQLIRSWSNQQHAIMYIANPTPAVDGTIRIYRDDAIQSPIDDGGVFYVVNLSGVDTSVGISGIRGEDDNYSDGGGSSITLSPTTALNDLILTCWSQQRAGEADHIGDASFGGSSGAQVVQDPGGGTYFNLDTAFLTTSLPDETGETVTFINSTESDDPSGVAISIAGEAGSSPGGIRTVSFWARPSTATQPLINLDASKNIDISSGTVRGNNVSTPTIYVDGQQTTSFPGTGWHHVAVTTNTAIDADDFLIGKISSSYYSGQLDEVRISGISRSSSWISTEYQNQSSPATFYSINSEEYQPLFDCRDVDIATGTQFVLGDANDCGPTATHWGVTFTSASNLLTLQAPTAYGTYVPTSTQMTIKIGTNAFYQAPGNSKILNPDSVGTFRISLGGTAGSSGDFPISINSGQTIEATVAEHLDFTVNGVYAAAWYDADWGYRDRITINTSEVAGSATSFPVLINSTDLDWRHTDQGGHVGISTGLDFVFTDSNGTTKLDHEIEKYTPGTGELIAWVRIPFLSNTSTNSLYIYYGNPDSTDQQNRHGVWNENFVGVWHMTTTSTQTDQTFDSTANSNTGTKVNAYEPSSTTTGQIDGAQGFDGVNDFINAGSNTSLDDIQNQGGGGMTVSFWINPQDTAVSALISKGVESTNSGAWIIVTNINEVGRVSFWKEGVTDFAVNWNNTLTIGAMQHVVITWDGTGLRAGLNLYKNGSLMPGSGNNDDVGLNSDASNNLIFGSKNGTSEYSYVDMDEVHISNIIRSASWIQTEYQNQSSPSTFYSLGGEQAYSSQGCVADDGATVSVIDGQAASISFGNISASTFYQACQDLIVSTNAPGGYSVSTQENHPLLAGQTPLSDTTCNSGACSESVGGSWTTNTVYGFGHTCSNQSSNDCISSYGNGQYFRQFADISAGETSQLFMSSTTPGTATGRIKFRLNRSPGQAAGTYTNTITYTVVGTY